MTANRPTALISYADLTAAGLLSGLLDLGLGIPRDMSIVGYDNQIFGRMLRPQLTTLAPAYERMGEFATETLLAMIEGAKGKSLALPPQLVMRQSVRDLPQG